MPSAAKLCVLQDTPADALAAQALIHSEDCREFKVCAAPSPPPLSNPSPPAAYRFVFFKTQAAAALAAQALIHSEDCREFKVCAAPGPEEVNWSALWLSYKQRDFRGWFTKPLLVIIMLIPINMFS